MSYYRPSFSDTSGMSRGRGGYSSSRGGSYRGRGSSNWSDRGSRGNFSSHRGGRFSSSWNHNNSNSFDSRSRYNSSSGPGSHDRYNSSSRGRHDDSRYRPSSYRSDGPGGYSTSRDNSGRSPDRKRMRTEAPSSHRSHDGSYGGGDGFGGTAGRYDSSQGSYGDRRNFNEDRRPGGFRPPRDDYNGGRKSMAPPVQRSSPRGIYRGRGSASARAARSARISMREALVRRRIADTRVYLRRRATLRSTSDYLRRLRISRIRSAASRRTVKKVKSSDKEEESEKEAENWEDEATDVEKKEDEPAKESEESRVLLLKKSPKKEKDDEKDKSLEKEEKKSIASNEGGVEDDRLRSKYTGRPFIKLTCVHCNMKCVTFREYSNHLFSGRHISAMRKVALKQKSVLARMRQAQRSAQRELEKTDDSLAPRTIFCPLCKLNYRQLKAKHQMSDAHRSMKKFLMPYCRVCHITFKSPMLYENHLCSLDHIKRKSDNASSNGNKIESDREPDSPIEEDGENFMTLDSVGDVDEEDEDGNKIVKKVDEDGETSIKSKESINVGVEHVKKVEVYYCDLCNFYLSRHEDTEKLLSRHCRGRLHLQRYVRYKEDKDLRRQAERMHRKSQAAKEAKEKEKEKEKEKNEKLDNSNADPEEESNAEMKKGTTTEEEAVDDKMWADVDKDLGEILAEMNTEPGNKSSDEDDDSRPNGERYDRFKYSEKGNEEPEVKMEANEKDDVKKETGEAEKNDEEKEKSTEDN